MSSSELVSGTFLAGAFGAAGAANLSVSLSGIAKKTWPHLRHLIFCPFKFSGMVPRPLQLGHETVLAILDLGEGRGIRLR
jgi:hypothetical protein